MMARRRRRPAPRPASRAGQPRAPAGKQDSEAGTPGRSVKRSWAEEVRVLDARTRRRVLDAAAGMEWHPDGAIEVLTDDYRLIRYPDWALDPAFPAAQVTRSRSGRPATEVIEEVTARVRRWG